MKWKIKFDVYKQKLPPYYNSFMNTCLKFAESRLKERANIQQILLPETDIVYREKRQIHELVKSIRKYQADIEYGDENRFIQSKVDHDKFQTIGSFEDRSSQVKLLCCQNI